MILADTSAWIEYDRATDSPVHRRVRELLPVASLAVTEPVIAEVLVGARTDSHEVDLRRFLARFTNLPFEIGDFDAAVRVYRRCRRVGVTPRGLVDCMVAAVAIRTSSTILAHDADLARIAEVMGIALDPASLAAR